MIRRKVGCSLSIIEAPDEAPRPVVSRCASRWLRRQNAVDASTYDFSQRHPLILSHSPQETRLVLCQLDLRANHL